MRNLDGSRRAGCDNILKKTSGVFKNVHLNRLFGIILSCLLVFVSVVSSPVYVDAASHSTFPIMSFTSEERALQNEVLLSAPEAVIDQQIQKDLQSYQQGSSFSLLSYLYYVPEERNQGHIGNCWVWAGTGCMEIALNVQLGIMDRLSVQYLDSLYSDGSGDDWAGNGGTAADFADFYDDQQMIISWANINAYYQDYNSDDSAAVDASEIATNSSYLLDSVDYAQIRTYDVGQETAIMKIKNVLNQNKGVFFAFYLANDEDWNEFYDFWDDESESSIWDYGFSDGEDWDDEEGGGHAVLCVGYDDTDPDPANHYWIMLNSWGVTPERPNGLFRVSMYYDYDAVDADGSYNTEWWTIKPEYLGTVQKGVDVAPSTSDYYHPMNMIPASW